MHIRNTGNTFEYGTHTYIDLLKLIDKSYGSATLGLQTPKPLNFWMRFGGFGSSSNPGNGWSGESDYTSLITNLIQYPGFAIIA